MSIVGGTLNNAYGTMNKVRVDETMNTLVAESCTFGGWISNRVNGTMIFICGAMSSNYGAMRIIGGTMSSNFGTNRNIGGTMSTIS